MYIEGVPLTSIDTQGDNRRVNQALSVDAVDQTQVQTGSTSAQYQGIGMENFSVKQGTNQVHGNISDFVRNRIFNAWTFLGKTGTVTNPDGTTSPAPKPPDNENELSASISGPILKNRLFFFFNYDRYHESVASTRRSSDHPHARRARR